MNEKPPGVREIWDIFRNPPDEPYRPLEERDPILFLRYLQEFHPCPKSIFKKDHLFLKETFLIYQNINPRSFDHFDILPDLYDQIIRILDPIGDLYLFETLENHFSDYRYGANTKISTKEFIDFLRQKDFVIPPHFPRVEFLEKNEFEEEGMDEVNPNTRKDRPDTQRKKIMNSLGDLLLNRLQNEGKKIPKGPGALARTDEMKQAVKLVNKIGGLKPIGGENETVDPKWFSSLYPNEPKPGPKSYRNNPEQRQLS